MNTIVIIRILFVAMWIYLIYEAINTPLAPDDFDPELQVKDSTIKEILDYSKNPDEPWN